MTPKTILLMAGGTGGHIFPALAVAQSLQQQGHNVVWLGSHDSMEQRLVPQHNIPLELIAMKGVRGKGLLRKLALPLMLLRCVQAAKAVIRKHHIDAVIGFGGFVTFPGGLAAKLLGVPMFVHEQDDVAGMANKRLAKWAARVLYFGRHRQPENRGEAFSGCLFCISLFGINRIQHNLGDFIGAVRHGERAGAACPCKALLAR